MTLVDSNVFMYAAGREHPHKKPATAFVEKVAAGSVEAIIDVEVIQEILPRYRAFGRLRKGVRYAMRLGRYFRRPWRSRVKIVDRAQRLLEARDAVHAVRLNPRIGFDLQFRFATSMRWAFCGVLSLADGPRRLSSIGFPKCMDCGPPDGEQ